MQKRQASVDRANLVETNHLLFTREGLVILSTLKTKTSLSHRIWNSFWSRSTAYPVTMAESKPAPPSLDAGRGQDFGNGFDQLVQHNAATSYQQSPFQTESNAYQQSASSTAYNSPEPRHVLLDPYDPRYYSGGVPGYYDGSRLGVYGVGDQALHPQATLLMSDTVEPWWHDVPQPAQCLPRHDLSSKQCRYSGRSACRATLMIPSCSTWQALSLRLSAHARTFRAGRQG